MIRRIRQKLIVQCVRSKPPSMSYGYQKYHPWERNSGWQEDLPGWTNAMGQWATAAARRWVAAVAAVGTSGMLAVLETIVSLSSDRAECLEGLVTSPSFFLFLFL